MTTTTSQRLPTIVYVEDNTGDAVLLEEAFQYRGYAVQLLVIDDGEKALHYFQVKESARDVPPPHCILLDDHLPIVSGGHLLRFIRGSRVYDQTPVYLFSAEAGYETLIAEQVVKKESFIRKANSWPEMLALADLLMRSAATAM